MKFNKNEFGWKEKVSVNTDELVTKNDIPHYNETLITEISGDDYRFFLNNNYFNISALNIDETKSYIVKNKFDINDDEEYTFKFVYDKEADVLINEDNQLHIYNHKSYNGTNLIEDVNSAVLTNNNNITPMTMTPEYDGYFRLYEVDKVELDSNCLSDDVNIKNSLTVGNRIGDIGECSVAEGFENTASGNASHAEGDGTTASGYCSHTEGFSTIASSNSSHAEGNSTTASGEYSHAEGTGATADGYTSHAEGNSTIASGAGSHAEGDNTTASGNYSHVEGSYTTADGEYSHAEGSSSDSATIIIQNLSSSTTNDSIITTWNSNKFSLAKGTASHVEGFNCLALDNYSHAEGNATQALYQASHAEGTNTVASDICSHAEGYETIASGGYSHAEGSITKATELYSHAEGNYSEASGKTSHAEGYETIASGEYSHAEGYKCKSESNSSHAEGCLTEANNFYTHAEGFYTIAKGYSQHVQGKCNIEDTAGKYAHIVGNGESETERSNAHTLDWQGNGWYAGKLTQEGTPTEDKDLTTKKYVDDKTEILPVKNNYIIFEDVVPSSTEVASDGLEYYIFDSLQNEDMIISAVKYNLNVTFNDGTNDRTMDLIIERSLKDGVFCEKDGFGVQVSYSETNHAIRMILVNANDYTQYSILKATLNCDSYSNLLQDYHIENINYDKIKEVPTALNSIANYKDFTLKGKEYYELYDNLSIWDANKFNERLDENSGVKRNEFFKLLGEDKYTLQIKQKDSEGIGFGQHISIDNSKNVHIVADAGVDVIIKIYNSTTKELIGTLNYCEAGFYKTRIINKDYLNGVTSIFIAFTVKDSTESFYGNTYVNDLIVHYDSSFLVKEEILTKTNTKEYIPTGDYNPATKKYVDDTIANQPQISFDAEGNLVVTIGGVTKKFKEITE